MQTLNLLWHRHKWTSIDIKWHLKYVAKSELAAGSTSEAVDLTTLSQHHCVHVST